MIDFKFKEHDIVYCNDDLDKNPMVIKKSFYNHKICKSDYIYEKDLMLDWNSYEMQDGAIYLESSLSKIPNIEVWHELYFYWRN